MHKGFFTDVMQHRPALFATMLAFNGLQSHGRDFTARQEMAATACAHALSDVQGLSAANVAALAASPVVQRHLFASSASSTSEPFASEPFASEPSTSEPSFPQSSAPFWDFAEESRRLVFLSPDELTTLLKLFGVAIHAKFYAPLVNHADVVALRQALGADIYTYGLVRGRFQLGSIARFFYARGQVLGNTGQRRDVETILQNIARDGDVALALCMATWPQSLQDRACTLLGRTISPILDADANTVRGVWFALKKLLLREVAPQWAPCFD